MRNLSKFWTERKPSTVWTYLFVSLFVHIIFVIFTYQSPEKQNSNSHNITVELTSNTQKMPVRQTETHSKKKNIKSKEKPRYSSKKRQRVQEQTRAHTSGKTINRSQRLITKPSRKRRLKTKGNKEKFSSQTPRMKSFKNVGVSTVGEKLDSSIKVGSFTALNTDRHLYYSFYTRIEDKIRYRWERGIHKSLLFLKKHPYRIKRKKTPTWETDLYITLNNKGQIKRILIKEESGISLFDQAATHSFWRSKVFPNPPKDLINQQGLVHLKYRFTVNWSPKTF